MDTPTCTPAHTLTPTGTPTSTPTATITITPTAAATPMPCEMVASDDVTIYNRSSTDAQIFATVGDGFRQRMHAMTQDGWVGFDPGVAQAANIRPFRIRWISPTGAYSLEGSCEALPVLEWVPPPGLCFTMPMIDTNVYRNTDASAAVITTRNEGEFAAVLDRTSDNDWAWLDLDPGNAGLEETGWVEGFSYVGLRCPLPNLSHALELALLSPGVLESYLGADYPPWIEPPLL